MKIQIGGLAFFWRPGCVRVPSVRSGFKSGRSPRWFFTFAVKIVAEERRLNILSEFAACFVASKRDDADRFALSAVPLAMEPGPGNNEVRVIGIVFSCVPENLPGSPGIFLIPETGDVQVRHSRGVQLI